MKPRLLFTPLACLAAALILWLAIATAAPREPAPESPVEGSWPKPMTIVDAEYRGRTAEQWYRQMLRERRAFRHRLRAVIHSPLLGGHWLERAFGCIGDGEGGWGSDTGNGYFGRYQMDRQFQRTYGGWALRAFGLANRWPASVQTAVAIEAWASGRGFAPWPNTSRVCGLR